MKRIAFLLFIFLFSCTAKKMVDKLPFKYLKFESTGCEGSCETFSMLIKPQRLALMNITEANKSKGSYSRSLSPEEFNGLVSLLDKMKVMNLKDKYGLGAEDTKMKFFSIGLGDKEKKIRYQSLAPPDIRELEKYIMLLRKNQKWKKI